MLAEGTPAPRGSTWLSYYGNRGLEGELNFSRCEDAIDHDWGFTESPGNGVGTDNFSARWTGNHSFEAVSYTFSATANDGVRVWVDDELIIDQWRDQAATTYEVTCAMTASEHEVKVEYYENRGLAVAHRSAGGKIPEARPIHHRARPSVHRLRLSSGRLVRKSASPDRRPIRRTGRCRPRRCLGP